MFHSLHRRTGLNCPLVHQQISLKQLQIFGAAAQNRVPYLYIYKSQDGGILFGRILNYQLLGLTDIINTYNLPTTVVLFNPHVQISTALPIIWQYAENSAKEAFDIIEGKEKIKSIPETYNGPVAQIAQVRDSTPEEILVENLAREMQCNTHPVAAKTAAKDDYTEYSVYCSKGHSQLFHCNNGSCKPLKK
jgi:hypothetical protein